MARQVGEPIARDEPLLEISTDKVDTEVPSPAEGVVAEILVQEGETVEVGTVLARIAAPGAEVALRRRSRRSRAGARPAAAPEPAPAAAEAAPATPAPPAPEPPVERAPAPGGARSDRGSRRAGGSPAAAPAAAGNGRTFVSPVVARIAAEHGIDASVVPGTGTGGRVTKKDILSYIESGASAAPPPAPAVPPLPLPRPSRWQPRWSREAAPAPAPPPVPVAAAPSPLPQRLLPHRLRLRRPHPTPAPAPAAPLPAAAGGARARDRRGARADDGDAARRDGAHAPLGGHGCARDERDRGGLARVVSLRQKLKPELAAQKVNLTYLAFIARATVDTLLEYPWVNGELRGQSIVTRPFVNLGIAVALEDGKGLIVPVIRNAQDLNLTGTARAIQDLAERARTKKLLPDDVQGGTFTITNPGSFGTFHGTPIINQPQSAILGTYALVKRPWVVQDELGSDVIAIRPLMNLTLTYDHRLVDGAYAGMYLRDLRERLESWDEAVY